MTNPNISLTPIKHADRDLIREWRNAPSTREMMFNVDPIDFKTHQQWFNALLQDKTKQAYIVSLDGFPFSMIFFSQILSNKSLENAAEWGFYNAPNAPSGLAFSFLSTALDFAFIRLELTRIDARVKSHNHKVLHLHNKLGFYQHPALKMWRSENGKSLPYYTFSLSRVDFLISNKPLPSALDLNRPILS